MSDKAEKLAAAKKKFKEYQSQKHKREILVSEQKPASSCETNPEGSKSVSGSISPASLISSSNGIDGRTCQISAPRNRNQESNFTPSAGHSRTSSASIPEYQYETLFGSQNSNVGSVPGSFHSNAPSFYDERSPNKTFSEENKPNGLFVHQKIDDISRLVIDNSSRSPNHIIKPFIEADGNRYDTTVTSQISSPDDHSNSYNDHSRNIYETFPNDASGGLNSSFTSDPNARPFVNSNRMLHRQFSQIEPEGHSGVAQLAPNFDEAAARLRQKKNLLDFQSSKSSSAESEKTNTLFNDPSSSSDSVAVPSVFPHRTDSVSTVYSSSDNQDRKLSMLTSYTVGDSFDHPNCDTLELEKRIEELTALLHAERVKSNETKTLYGKAENRINELQNQLQLHQNIQNEVVKGTTESLENQMKNYVRTIEILVSEKSELEQTLDSFKRELDAKNSQLQVTLEKLVSTQHQITKLEEVVTNSQSIRNKLLETEVELSSLKRETLMSHEELSNNLKEAKQNLESKSNELNQIQEELHDTKSQLSLAQLRIQQLSSNDGAENCDNELKVLQDMNTGLTTKVASLEQTIRSLEVERENSSAHYQQYIRSLNAEINAMKNNFEALSNEKDRLSVREESLIKHVAELEKQLQAQQLLADELNAKINDPSRGAHNFTDYRESAQKIAALETEKKNLEDKLKFLIVENEKVVSQAILNEAKLEQLEGEQIDMTSLQNTIESDRVAASRAIQQNNNLKQQLQELQDAFIKLSNEKLELTEKLLHEERLNKNHVERLSQMTNNVEHQYHEHGMPERHDGFVEEAVAALIDDAMKVDADIQTDLEIQNPTNLEAMTKLEEKFRKTMKDLADLSDEKQRLEHLVMQLQSETETIGEYVALYQTQRGALQEKAKEKEQQVVKLAQDKENLRNKLAELTELIKNLISKQDAPQKSNTTDDSASLNEEHVDAEQIMNLLSDIGTTSLHHSVSNFHPCPWCSGQLITV